VVAGTFSREEISALAALKEVWSGSRFCLIGASALRAQLPTGYWRTTRDLDLIVAVSLDVLHETLGRDARFAADPRLEHRWYGPAGVPLDVLPASPALVTAGEIVWPRSGGRMSLQGVRLVFATARPIEVGAGVTVDVPSLATIALLKMISYLDRPYDRERDLQDLAHLLDEYVAAEDRFTDDLLDAGVGFDDASAYQLGSDLGRRVTGDELDVIRTFVAKARNPNDAMAARILRFGPRRWADDPDQVIARVAALERGLSAQRG
jgi:predicted nucleotidyltransferase